MSSNKSENSNGTNGVVNNNNVQSLENNNTTGALPQMSILKSATPADGECELCEKGVPDHHHDIFIDDPEATEADLTHCRIGRIANLEKCKSLLSLCLRWNSIAKIEGLDQLENLEELDLYDNQIVKIEQLSALKKLRILDLSFNRITKIENLVDLAENLKKLYFVENRITRIENLGSLVKLEMLELGSNKIQKLEGLDKLVELTELYLGRNRIRSLEGCMSTLRNLRILSLASNRITRIEGLDNLSALEQLYLSSNSIEKIEGLDKNLELNTLDLAENKIERIENITHLPKLEEFWLELQQQSGFWPPGYDVDSSPAASGQDMDGVRVTELVELLADISTPLEVKIQAAIMLQHLTYLDPFVKAEVTSFDVSHHLITLLATHHRNVQIPKVFTLSLLGALRNICSGADSTSRKSITAPDNNHSGVLLDVIVAHQSCDSEGTAVRELATAVLWNISVDLEIANRLTESGVLDVIARAIILPSIHAATKTSSHAWGGWCTDFKNSTGILRNCTANHQHSIALVNGTSGTAPIRLLIESFTLAVRFSVTQQDTESKAVENIVCFLQNITAAISSEAARCAQMKRATSTPNVANENDHEKSSLGCALVGSQWRSSRNPRNIQQPNANGKTMLESKERQLISVACARSLVEALLPLLADCSNPTTLEAGLGTIRNVVSIASAPKKQRDAKSSQNSINLIADPNICDVAREAVWRSGGLPIVVDLLAITSDAVLRSAASVLAALGTTALGAADTDGVLVIRELIGKQALDRLVRKLPTPNEATLTESFPSDQAICSILAAILVIVRPFSQQQQAAFHQQIMTPSSPAAFALHAISDLGLITRLHFLVRPELFGLPQLRFDAQVMRLSAAVLATLWQHSELRPAYSRLGIDRMAFFPSTAAQPKMHSKSMMTLNNSHPIDASMLPFSDEQYTYRNSSVKYTAGTSGVYGSNTSLVHNGNARIDSYFAIEERLVGSAQSIRQADTGVAERESVSESEKAAQLEARRGSSSSAWTANLPKIEGLVVPVIDQPPAKSPESEELASTISDSTEKPDLPEKPAEDTQNEDDMFTLSQLNNLAIDDDQVKSEGVEVNPIVRPISANRELFMLAITSNAPDSWV